MKSRRELITTCAVLLAGCSRRTGEDIAQGETERRQNSGDKEVSGSLDIESFTSEVNCAVEEREEEGSVLDLETDGFRISGTQYVDGLCYSVSASVSESGGVLSVRLETQKTAKFCAQCIGEAEYEGRVSAQTSVYDMIQLQHDGEVVETITLE